MEKTRHDSPLKAETLTLEFFLKPLLEKAGISITRNIKLYKHVNHEHEYAGPEYRNENGEMDVQKIYKAGLMPEFQAANSGNKYGDDIILFFIPEDGRNSLFVGAYEIKKIFEKGTRCESDLAQRASGLKFYTPSAEHWFELQQIKQLDCLIERMIIRWQDGQGHRWFKNDDTTDIEFVQILPQGAFREFPGFDKLILTFTDLVDVLGHRGDNSWKEVLASTRGIYLITDTKSGALYVGSATGGEGFLQRWEQYAKNGHGGNKLIKLGINTGEVEAVHFQISILETMSNFASKQDGIDAESTWKNKLGRKAITLNGN